MRRLAAASFLLSATTFVASASVDQGLLALVPPGAQVIGGVDVDRAKSSALWQYVASNAHNDQKDFTDFVQETGFDPRRDIQQIVFAASPAGKQQESKVAVLGRGNFDMVRIRASARKKGWTVENLDGADMLVDKHENNGPNAFAFLGDGIAVLGEAATVKQIIANRSGPNALDASIQARITKTASENDIWFVSFVSGSEIANRLNPAPASGGGKGPQTANQGWPQAQALQSVQQASGGIQLGDMVRVTLDAITRSAKDAASLADAVRFFTSMVQMQRQNDPRAEMAADAFDKMELATNGEAVHVSVAFPEKSLEKMVDSSTPAGVRVQPRSNKQ